MIQLLMQYISTPNTITVSQHSGRTAYQNLANQPLKFQHAVQEKNTPTVSQNSRCTAYQNFANQLPMLPHTMQISRPSRADWRTGIVDCSSLHKKTLAQSTTLNANQPNSRFHHALPRPCSINSASKQLTIMQRSWTWTCLRGLARTLQQSISQKNLHLSNDKLTNLSRLQIIKATHKSLTKTFVFHLFVSVSFRLNLKNLKLACIPHDCITTKHMCKPTSLTMQMVFSSPCTGSHSWGSEL